MVVCGVDHLGLRTIDELRLRDEDVVAIGPTNDLEEPLAAQHVPLIVGDHRLPKTLRAAGIQDAGVIVLTSDDDLGNLNTALAASEINPRIRVVIRMFDQELGAHIPQLFPDAVALSSSALAAPGFVSAALDGETGSRFRLAGRWLSSRHASDPPTSTTSIPIARLHPDRSVEMLPDAGLTDPDLLLIDVSDAATGDPDPTDPSANPSSVERAGNPLDRIVAAIRDRLSKPERRLVRFAAILLVLAFASAIFFDVVAGLTPLDAISYAITLLTGAALPTNIDAASANVALRIYAIFLSLVGAAIVAVVYAFITDALIRSRLLQTLGRRTVPGNIRDHVIVAGLGSIGYRIALGLAARGVPVVVVEVSDDGRFVSPARAAGSRSTSATPDIAKSCASSGCRTHEPSSPRRAMTWSTSRPPSTPVRCGPIFASSCGCTTRTSRFASSTGSGSGSRAACRTLRHRRSRPLRSGPRCSRPCPSAIGG